MNLHAITLELDGELELRKLQRALDAARAAHPVPGEPGRDRRGYVEVVRNDGRMPAEARDPVDDALARSAGRGAPVMQTYLYSSAPGAQLLVFVFARSWVDPTSAMSVARTVSSAYRDEFSGPLDTHSSGSPRAPEDDRRVSFPGLPDVSADNARIAARQRTDRPRAEFSLPSRDVHLVARACSTGVRTVLTTLVAVALQRDGTSEALAVVTSAGTGDAAAGRDEQHTPLCVMISDETTFAEVVSGVDAVVAAAVPGAAVEGRALPVLRVHEAPVAPSPGFRSARWSSHPGPAPAGVAVSLTSAPDVVTGEVTGAAGVHAPDTLDRIAGHVCRLLAGVAADPARPVCAYPLLTPAEQAAFDAADGEELPARPPFHRVFAEQAARTPDAVAVRAQDGSLTYAALDVAANRLAHVLRAHGVAPGTTVGLHLDRGPGMATAILAVFRAGGTYVPLDPQDPPARRAVVTGDADVSLVLTETTVQVPGVTVLDLTTVDLADPPDHEPDVPDDPARAAYVLYTSGSTGTPKGVVVEHRNLTAYVDGVIHRLDLDRPLRFAMVQPLTVDSSVTAFFPPLCTGGEVHLLSRDTALDPDRFADWVTAHGVDCLKIAPSHLRALQASPRFAELLPAARLIVGGEASDWRWLRDLQRRAPRCRVFNHYGPTETTVGVLTLAVADHLDAEWDTAPIGRPLPGVRASVLDAYGNAVPVGVVGELVVAGATVARGYHDRPELTASAFAGGRYATGDRVRRLADGTIVFVGRRDDQVKVNGMRVELGEIDAALRTHRSVRTAVTVVREDVPGARNVVSYVESEAGPDELHRYLRERLAPPSVPRAVVVLDRIPLSPHGKIDRAALPAPPPVVDGTHAAPGTELERAVAGAWRAVLGTDAFGVESNFFDAGGHSLLLVSLQQRLRAVVDHEVDLMDLLAHTTVRAQARLLSGPGTPGTAGPQAPAGPPTPQRAALLRRRAQLQRARRDSDG